MMFNSSSRIKRSSQTSVRFSVVGASAVNGASQVLKVDGAQIRTFASALFRYADPHTHASLRGFDQLDSKRSAAFTRGVQIGHDLDLLIKSATALAQVAADSQRAIVFCPPIATFNHQYGARTVDLANGLALSVECDERAAEARARLEEIIGPATVVVASGGTWTDPETGEVQNKLHLHWRLSEPTRDAGDHERLRMARNIAARLVGADPSGKPIVHPLRWPGSWNCKAKPRMAFIVALNQSAEIHLDDALDCLQLVQLAGGSSVVDGPRRSGPEKADQGLIASAMQAIPNQDEHYDQWIRMGYAIFRATDGSSDGFDIWDDWSKKSAKFDADENAATWKRIGKALRNTSPDVTIGAGTIFYKARSLGWERPTPAPPKLESE